MSFAFKKIFFQLLLACCNRSIWVISRQVAHCNRQNLQKLTIINLRFNFSKGFFFDWWFFSFKSLLCENEKSTSFQRRIFFKMKNGERELRKSYIGLWRTPNDEGMNTLAPLYPAWRVSIDPSCIVEVVYTAAVS